MRTSFYLNENKISKKRLVSLLGDTEVSRIVNQAKELFNYDVNIQLDFATKVGTVLVIFSL